MGLFDLLFGKDAVWRKGIRKGGGAQKLSCPKCKTEITIDMERCPKCGTKISEMFFLECPNCKEKNPLDAKRCKKCGYDFEVEKVRREETKYVCPICGYTANYRMLSCPACGTKFSA